MASAGSDAPAACQIALLNVTIQCDAPPATTTAGAPFQPSQTVLVAVSCVAAAATMVSLVLVRPRQTLWHLVLHPLSGAVAHCSLGSGNC